MGDPRPEERIAVYASVAPTYVTLGNHEYGSGRDVDAAGRLVAWAQGVEGLHLPSKRFTADFGLGTLVSLDTNTAFQFRGATQAAWLDDVLPAIDGWRVVMGHHPLSSSGIHGNAGRYEGYRWVPWLSGRAVQRLIEGHVCGHADLYLAGHDHHLEVIDACGTVQVVSGAGAKTRILVDRGNDPEYASAELGFVWLELEADRGELRVYDADGVVQYRRPLTRGLRKPL